MEILVSLKKSGQIKYIGLSNYTYGQIRSALRVAKVNAVFGRYNIVSRNRDLLKFCYEESAAFLAKDLLYGEKFTDDYKSKKNRDPLSAPQFELRRFAEAAGKSVSQIAVSFAVHSDLVTSAFIRASNSAELERLTRGADFKLEPEEELNRIAAAYQLITGENF
jgi:aryl-alcohol dehydrogenase-like predicted oxidoreductase